VTNGQLFASGRLLFAGFYLRGAKAEGTGVELFDPTSGFGVSRGVETMEHEELCWRGRHLARIS
jgi:hypothetical protein